MWDEVDRYCVASVAIYNTGIIICQALPFVMNIFSWDIIHSAIAGIYYCHKRTWGNDFSLWISETERGPVFYRPYRDTIFLSFTHRPGFTMQSKGWNWFTATRLPPNCLFLQRQLWEEKWLHLSKESNDCLHC